MKKFADGGPVGMAEGGFTYNPNNQTYSSSAPQVGTGSSKVDFGSMNGLELFLSPLAQLYKDKFARESQQYTYDPQTQRYQGFADGGNVNQPQQVTQFQPTFSPAQQDIGSLQQYQAPDMPPMPAPVSLSL